MVMLHFHPICFYSRFSEISLAKSRSLSYFLVFPCILQFLVEMHYKIAAAVLHRHKCHRLAVIEVLINILGHRAAVSSTSKWVYIEKLYVFVVTVNSFKWLQCFRELFFCSLFCNFCSSGCILKISIMTCLQIMEFLLGSW